jgi:hypothetical protein
MSSSYLQECGTVRSLRLRQVNTVLNFWNNPNSETNAKAEKLALKYLEIQFQYFKKVNRILLQTWKIQARKIFPYELIEQMPSAAPGNGGKIVNYSI